MIMKKYTAIWGSAMFFVVCVSLYLMMETSTNSAMRTMGEKNMNLGASSHSIGHLDVKMYQVEKQMEDNKKVVGVIRDTVRQLIRGSDMAELKNLQHVLNTMDKNNVSRLQQSIIYNAISNSMCSDHGLPSAMADIKMSSVYDKLAFDNPPGGDWKQGFPITYSTSRWYKRKLKVFVVPHSHNDPGWIKTFENYYTTQTRLILNSMVNKLEQYPKMRFIYAEMSFFHLFWEESSAVMKSRIKKLLTEGRLEIVSGGWVMPDEANTHYFALVDQLIEGNQWLLMETGVKPQVSWSIDPFGHSPTMAYILRRAGMSAMLIQRVHYAVKKHLAERQQLEFAWRQQWDRSNTTDILCHMMPFYSYDIPHTCGPQPAICCQFDFVRLPGTGSRVRCPWNVAPVTITSDNVKARAIILLDQYRKKASLYRDDVVLIPLGDDFRYIKDNEWDQQYVNYQQLFDYINSQPELNAHVQFATLSEYFQAVRNRSSSSPHPGRPLSQPTLTGDFFTYSDRDDHYWSGYFTTRPFFKRLDRIVEAHLRGAEVLYSLAAIQSSPTVDRSLPHSLMLSYLGTARRQLALFQHHDGITGTAKDMVVVDYGNRLLSAITKMKTVIQLCADFLLRQDKTTYDASKNVFDVDDVRERHDSLPVKTVIDLSDKMKRDVVFYNSLGQHRQQMVCIHVSTPLIQVTASNGTNIASQISPYWTLQEAISNSVYKLTFVVDVAALGLSRYSIQQMSAPSNETRIASITIINSKSTFPNMGVFTVKKLPQTDSAIRIENSYLKLAISARTGMLQSISLRTSGETIATNTQFVLYGTRAGRERSGAYLFLPDGFARPLSYSSPLIRVIRGPLLAEVHVFMPHVQHIIRLHNSPGLDGMCVEVINLVDIHSLTNTEIAMRIETDVAVGSEPTFYTDLNGFQTIERRTRKTLPLQANFYPMPAMSFLQSESKRFTILSGQSLGVASLKPGWLEIMQDRRLNQDDGLGLTQGITDNRPTPNRFRLLVESARKTIEADTVPNPSLMSQLSSRQLLHPIHVLPSTSNPSTMLKPSYSGLLTALPCDIHLLNLRSLNTTRHTVEWKHSSALLLHRVGYDCAYPTPDVGCQLNAGKLRLTELLRDAVISSVTPTSLSLLHDQEQTHNTDTLRIPAMEIAAFKLKFK